MVARRHHVLQLHSQLQGACYDVEYALGYIKISKNIFFIRFYLDENLYYLSSD